eukprot:GHVQ01027138.1.p1 GENE.GHVQ01027138.1~~GHVQ01027138.1.p1  ORF type:complete len:1037 (-),score=171.72 GHVQ01027138.1:686-3796(-)
MDHIVIADVNSATSNVFDEYITTEGKVTAGYDQLVQSDTHPQVQGNTGGDGQAQADVEGLGDCGAHDEHPEAVQTLDEEYEGIGEPTVTELCEAEIVSNSNNCEVIDLSELESSSEEAVDERENSDSENVVKDDGGCAELAAQTASACSQNGSHIHTTVDSAWSPGSHVDDFDVHHMSSTAGEAEQQLQTEIPTQIQESAGEDEVPVNAESTDSDRAADEHVEPLQILCKEYEGAGEPAGSELPEAAIDLISHTCEVHAAEHGPSAVEAVDVEAVEHHSSGNNDSENAVKDYGLNSELEYETLIAHDRNGYQIHKNGEIAQSSGSHVDDSDVHNLSIQKLQTNQNASVPSFSHPASIQRLRHRQTRVCRRRARRDRVAQHVVKYHRPLYSVSAQAVVKGLGWVRAAWRKAVNKLTGKKCYNDMSRYKTVRMNFTRTCRCLGDSETNDTDIGDDVTADNIQKAPIGRQDNSQENDADTLRGKTLEIDKLRRRVHDLSVTLKNKEQQLSHAGLLNLPVDDCSMSNKETVPRVHYDRLYRLYESSVKNILEQENSAADPELCVWMDELWGSGGDRFGGLDCCCTLYDWTDDMKGRSLFKSIGFWEETSELCHNNWDKIGGSLTRSRYPAAANVRGDDEWCVIKLSHMSIVKGVAIQLANESGVSINVQVTGCLCRNLGTELRRSRKRAREGTELLNHQGDTNTDDAAQSTVEGEEDVIEKIRNINCERSKEAECVIDKCSIGEWTIQGTAVTDVPGLLFVWCNDLSKDTAISDGANEVLSAGVIQEGCVEKCWPPSYDRVRISSSCTENDGLPTESLPQEEAANCNTEKGIILDRSGRRRRDWWVDRKSENVVSHVKIKVEGGHTIVQGVRIFGDIVGSEELEVAVRNSLILDLGDPYNGAVLLQWMSNNTTADINSTNSPDNMFILKLGYRCSVDELVIRFTNASVLSLLDIDSSDKLYRVEGIDNIDIWRMDNRKQRAPLRSVEHWETLNVTEHYIRDKYSLSATVDDTHCYTHLRFSVQGAHGMEVWGTPLRDYNT